MAKKYIVKNCPARKPMITVDGKHGGKTMFDVCSEGKHTPCKDRTDCTIKQVVEMCKKYSCILSERGILASLILHNMQVEEVE